MKSLYAFRVEYCPTSRCDGQIWDVLMRAATREDAEAEMSKRYPSHAEPDQSYRVEKIGVRYLSDPVIKIDTR
jgi:hypothetical protein